MGGLAVVDYLIIGVYLALTLFIGAWVSRYIHTGREFFLAGRTLPWWAVGVSLVATDIGGTDIVGVGGLSYRYGIAVANFEWIGCIPAMIVAGLTLIPHFWRCGVTTIPEFLEKRFSVQVRTAVSACWLAFMACNLGIMLLASAKMMEALAGWPSTLTIWLVAILVAIYTYSGGLAAVVYTDVLQGIVMIAGCGIVTLIGLWQIGGLEPLQERVLKVVEQQQAAATPPASSPKPALRPADHFRLVLPVDTPSPFPWPAILFGLAFVISPAYWVTNQAIVQRALAARSEYEAKASYIFGALLKTLIPLVIVLPGMMALVAFPSQEDPDTALPLLIGRTMPLGVKGIFVAAFLAALMSSVDSYLNSATTLFTHDFYLRFVRPEADERRLLTIGRLMTIFLTGWGILFAFQAQQLSSGIYSLFQTMMSFINGPVLAVVLAGVLTTAINARGALIGLGAGVMTSISLYTVNHPDLCARFGWRPLFQIADPFLYYSIWAFLMTAVVMVIASYFSPADHPEKLAFAMRRRADQP